MKPCLIALFSFSLVFGALAEDAPKSKNEPASAAELKIIDQFADRLFVLIQKKDAKDYADLFAKQNDRLRNLKTRKPADVPMNPNPDRPVQFLAVVADIEKVVGGTSSVTLKEVEYTIRRDPHDKEFGIFVFDVTLVLEGRGKILHVRQPSCALGMRGVLINDGIRVLKAGSP